MTGPLDDLIAAERRSMVVRADVAASNRAAIDEALAAGWQIPPELAVDPGQLAAATAGVPTVGKWLIALVLTGAGGAAATMALDSEPAARGATDGVAQTIVEVVPDDAPADDVAAAKTRVATTDSKPSASEPESPRATPSTKSPNASTKIGPSRQSSTRSRSRARSSITSPVPSPHDHREARTESPQSTPASSATSTRDRTASRSSSSSASNATTRYEHPPEQDNSARDGASTYADELDLLERANALVDSGSLRRARRLLRRHETTYPRGTFAAERDALLVVCECGLDDDADQRNALVRRFERVHAGSPFAGRVERACDTSAH